MKFSIRNYTRLARAVTTQSVPVYAHFGVTHRCNLTCKMCGIWRYGNAKEELSIAEVTEVAKRMKRLGVVQVSLGGVNLLRVKTWQTWCIALLKRGSILVFSRMVSVSIKPS